MKLISMTDFILNQELPTYLQKEEFEEAYYKLHNYANFLKQTLKLEMLVPCVDGEVFNYSMHGNKEQFLEAKAKCFFEGFVITEESFIHDLPHFYIEIDGIKIMWNFNNKWVFYKGFKTIEDLVKYNLQITQKAIKKIHQ